ncbi:MAG: alanine/ornithine racemase family PLP-dependent enzyme [Chitinophagales bacterium]|nr:alanine/ornithine racemase family PLP-dependent enzyme [Chitinophagaceae bacterium]MCB9064394.1 alanine/ornithine racemase family PLP-dependent enzyme [Chitinophagales bacterium]
MAFVTLDAAKLKKNFTYLDELFEKHNIKWSVVSKMLCGNKTYLDVLIKLGITEACDSRVTNLKRIKAINPNVETAYIKPPAKRSIKNIVQYADVSFNTEYDTIKLLSQEAVAQDKLHKVIIMIELGELREGVMRDDFMDFYAKVFELPNIDVIGIGTNLTCMYGVLPNHDKLIQLSLYKELIEAKFNKKIPYVSGGSSVTIPLIFQNLLPNGVNHFRVGETLFLGTDVYHNKPFDQMHGDVFKLYAEIIELNEKPSVPMGEIGYNLTGDSPEFDTSQASESSYRAIIDLGLLDIESTHLKPTDDKIELVGESSDMIVVDLGTNPKKYKVGDLLEFNMTYMGILRVMNSVYVTKKVVNEHVLVHGNNTKLLEKEST